jgi:hypothetical protein
VKRHVVYWYILLRIPAFLFLLLREGCVLNGRRIIPVQYCSELATSSKYELLLEHGIIHEARRRRQQTDEKSF